MSDLAPPNGQHHHQHTSNGRAKPRRKSAADTQQHNGSDQKTGGKTRKLGEIERAYSYRDERGNLVFQVCRFEGEDKVFRQRRPKPGGGWEWSVKGCRVVPYRLPELLAEPSRVAFIPEGEKDVDNLRSVGLVATTNAKGAGNWTQEHAAFLPDRRVVILPDNDQKGRDHARSVAETLRSVAKETKILELPGLPEKGDVSDWLDRGGTVEDLRRLVQQAPSAEEWGSRGADPDQNPEPEFEPLPAEILPEPIRSYVQQSAAALGCDESFLAVPMLAVLAAAVGNSRSIRLKNSWQEPAVIWSVTVGSSGTMKSPSWELAVRPLQQLQDAAFREFAADQEQYEQNVLLYEAALYEWKKSGRKAGEPSPDAPEEPLCTRYLAADATVEACCRLLAENDRGILLARDELSGWLNGFDAYKSARGADVAHWLSFHRAGGGRY